MPIVYCTHANPRIDISQAENYGRIKVLLPEGDANYTQLHTWEKLNGLLADFDLENDLVLLTGDPVVIFMVGAILSDIAYTEMHFAGINVLKWNKFSKKYLQINVPINKEEDCDE